MSQKFVCSNVNRIIAIESVLIMIAACKRYFIDRDTAFICGEIATEWHILVKLLCNLLIVTYKGNKKVLFPQLFQCFLIPNSHIY